MNSTWVWIVVVAVIAVGAYWLWQSNTAPAVVGQGTSVTSMESNETSQMPTLSEPSTTEKEINQVSMSENVSYDGSSFSPSSVIIKKGGTVTWTSSVASMWVASGPHPAHTGYEGTNLATHCAGGYSGPKPFDQCGSGTSYSFTFTKTGTWPYHDHRNSSAFGSVTVVE